MKCKKELSHNNLCLVNSKNVNRPVVLDFKCKGLS